jgi:prepilin-type N-terminal cleavage/methylation domain-containing protein
MSKACNKKLYMPKNGFTLIEVMVALAILSIVGLGLINAFPFGASIIRDSKNLTYAAYIAQTKIEEIISTEYFAVPVGTIEAKQPAGPAGTYLFEFEREASIYYLHDDFISTSTDPANDIGFKIVNVDIFYKSALAKNEKNYRLSYLMSRR